jgi:hypothetical protein
MLALVFLRAPFSDVDAVDVILNSLEGPDGFLITIRSLKNQE